ncbi:hypothetical protein HY061_01675 [Candidatus Azambacteria bacterium]|nr:hypothetical protein [Candidatus Azambacteria bacterium]
MNIYCLGPEGSNGSQVADGVNFEHFDGTATLVLCPRNTDILTSVAQSKSSAIGIVPVHNSIGGAVVDVMNWLNNDNHRLIVIGKIDRNIEHHLLVRQNRSLKDVQIVISHAQGLAQCKEWLSRYGFSNRHRYVVTSTSVAAQIVSQASGFTNVAAIASKECVAKYSLKIVAENIEDDKKNTTCFHIVTNDSNLSLPLNQYIV